MEPDLEDTRAAVPRTGVRAARVSVDVEDTVARGSIPASDPPAVAQHEAPAAAEEPPALIEPPAPDVRAVPAVVEELPQLVPTTATPASEGPAPMRVRVSNGVEVPLDVAVYVGRNPSVPRIHVGPEPRLVAVASPLKEVSATHLELRLVGDALVATDMRSTNGTTVRLPGAAPRTLIRGESIVILPGTRIDLGEGAVLDILAPASGDSGEGES